MDSINNKNNNRLSTASSNNNSIDRLSETSAVSVFSDEFGLPLDSKDNYGVFDFVDQPLTAEYRSLSILDDHMMPPPPSSLNTDMFASPLPFRDPMEPLSLSSSLENNGPHPFFANHSNFQQGSFSLEEILMKEMKGMTPPAPKIDIVFFPLEKTTIYTDDTPEEMTNDITNVLKEQNVSIVKFNAEKFKFKCSFYNGCGPKLHFVVRIYTINSEEKNCKYAIEFTRRAGCMFQWRNLYDSMKAGMTGDLPVMKEMIDHLDLPKELEKDFAVEEMEKSLAHIVEEFKSCHLENQIEICQSFASLSKSYINSKSMDLNEDHIAMFHSLINEFMNSNEPMIRLNALSCLGNLKHIDGLTNNLLIAVIKSLSTTNENCIDTMREASRVLSNLSTMPSYKSDIKQFGGLEELLKQSKCQDKIIRENSRTALYNLVSAT